MPLDSSEFGALTRWNAAGVTQSPKRILEIMKTPGIIEAIFSPSRSSSSFSTPAILYVHRQVIFRITKPIQRFIFAWQQTCALLPGIVQLIVAQTES